MIYTIRNFIVVLGAVLITATSLSQNPIKVMVYNLLEFPSALPGGRPTILMDILNQYNPDIFMVCELESEIGADQILNFSLNDQGLDYERAPFTINQSSSSNLQQLVFFRKGMFTLESAEILITNIRDINHYQLKVNTADGQTDPLLLELFVAHLKSSTGTANQQERLNMVLQFTNRLTSLDPNSYVIFAGDFNLYTSNEPAYQEILDPTNAIVMADPINRPGSWSNNTSFQDIHTQSTRISSGGFGAGAGGGLDDRFDFEMISQNMLTDPKLRYVPDTYKAFGNNGNCFNNDVSSPDCTGEFGQDLRNRLFSMSDHLPVVMTLETNKEIVLGTQDIALENAIFLQNTIVKDELKLQIANTVQQDVFFEVYNTLGQKLIQFNSQKNRNLTINLSHLANGVYFLKTNLPNIRTFKFLKTS